MLARLLQPSLWLNRRPISRVGRAIVEALVMKRIVFVFGLLLLLAVPLAAQRGRQRDATGEVALAVLDQKVTSTASPDKDLVYFKVRITNGGDAPVVYTNNRFLLLDTEGGKHMVSRPWYAQGDSLAPGQSVEVDRVYFEIPKSSHPAELSLMGKLRVLASVKLKA